MVQFIFLLASFAFAQMGLVNSTKGDAKLTRSDTVSIIKIGSKIYPKDVITTGADSFVKIITSDKNVFIIQENTQLEISSYISAEGQTKGSGKLNLKEGALHSEIKQKYEEEGNTFRIRTPSAVAGIRGTEFLTTATVKETTISTFSGQVMMAAKEENGKLVSPVSIGAGFQFSGQVGQMGNAGKFMGQPMKLDAAKLDQLKNSAMSGQFKNMPQQPGQPNQPGKPGQQGSPQNGGQKSQAPGMKREQMGPPKDKQNSSQMGNMNPQDKKGGANQTDDNSQKKKGPPNGNPGGMKGPGSNPGGPGMPPGGGMKPGMPNGPRPGAPAGGMMPPPPPPPPPGGNGP